MSVNIFGGQPNACIATTTQTFASMGLDTTNTYIIYEVGVSLKSWNPERAINAITGTTAGNGYYFVARVDMDLTAYFDPPITDLPPVIDIILSAGLQEVLDNNNISSTGLEINDGSIKTNVDPAGALTTDTAGDVFGFRKITIGGITTYYMVLRDRVSGFEARIKVGTLAALTVFSIPGWRAGEFALAGDGVAPAVTAGTSAGTTPTINLLSNADDVAGSVSVHTGTSPAVSNTIFRITFGTAYPVAPTIILTPGNGLAAALSGNAQVFAFNITAAYFEVFVGSTALAASSTYIWNYHVDK